MEGWREQTLFAKGPVVIFTWRNEPGWPVEAVSPNVIDVLGYPAQALLSGELSYAELVEPQDAPRVSAEVKKATAQGKESFEHEPYRLFHRDGSVRWVHDFTHVLRDGRGVATHYVGYIFDITRRINAEAEARELERQLLHAQKLESLGVLAGGVAHDFNNLLTGMLGQLALAQRAAPTDNPKLAGYLQQLEGLTQHAAALTNQLLAYSGKGNFVVEPVDLNELLEEMAQMIQIAVSRRATLVKRFADVLPLVVADRTQLKQVAMNLLSNASEALMDQPGTIAITTRFEPADAEGVAHVALEVADSGVGMDAATQARIFEPFFTTKFTGRGLGMPAVLGIVRGHNGTIDVRSAPGLGATFVVRLPVGATERRSRSTPVSEPPPYGAGREPSPTTVLVVDDEEVLRETCAELLQGMGHRVLLARDGAEALALHDAHVATVGLVILDLTMPVMPGERVLAELRARGARIPIILSSGYSLQQALPGASALESSRAADDGALWFLKKPYSLAEFERTVRKALIAP